MSDIYMAVDSGKFGTKVAVISEDRSTVKNFQFRTKTGKGDLDDDMLEKNTVVIKGLDGDNVYKVGNGAPNPAEMSASKKTFTHKLCICAAIARVAADGDTVHLAIGMPFDECKNTDKRHEFRDYMMNGGAIDIDYKSSAQAPAEHKHINIADAIVCPESAGAVYIDIKTYYDKAVAVIDIGNKNTNNTLFQNLEPESNQSYTTEYGGGLLISGLAQELTAKFSSRVDELLVSKILKQQGDKRCLTPIRPDKETEEKSRQVIEDYLMDYIRDIRRTCDVKGWPIDYMNVLFIGGTTGLVSKEIREVFGDGAVIMPYPEFVNANGFLARLVGLRLGIDTLPPVER